MWQNKSKYFLNESDKENEAEYHRLIGCSYDALQLELPISTSQNHYTPVSFTVSVLPQTWFMKLGRVKLSSEIKQLTDLIYFYSAVFDLFDFLFFIFDFFKNNLIVTVLCSRLSSLF